MRRLSFTLIAGLLGLLMVNGCQKDTGSALTDEQMEEQSIQDLMTSENIEESDYLADWGIDDGSEDHMFNGYSTFSPGSFLLKVTDFIPDVVRFGRKLNRQIPRTFITERICEDTIIVHMERAWTGQFVIFQKLDSTAGSPDTMIIYRKPLTHLVKRTSILTRRIEDEEAMRDPRRRWKLAAVSLGLGESRPVNTVQIQQVEVNSSAGDFYSFTDPLYTILSIPEDLPAFLPGEIVMVKVWVSNSTTLPVINPADGSTETLLLHFGVNRMHRARKQFEYRGIDPNNGYHVFEGQWMVREPIRRPFHAVIDAIDNGTIYDDDGNTYPYNSTTWGIPYRVVLNK